MNRFLFLALLLALPAQGFSSSKVDGWMKKMTMEQKIGQMILVYHSPYFFLKKHNVGAVLIMKNMLKDPSKLKRELDDIQRRLPIPILVTIDQEGGTVNRLGNLKNWKKTPSARELSKWDERRISKYGEKVAAKLQSLGVNTNLAPVLDPETNDASRKTYMAVKERSFGDGADKIARPARAFAQGLKKKGVLSISKHFPGYDVETNSDYEVSESDADMKAVKKHVEAFEKVKRDVDGIMMSNIRFKKISDEPAVMSKQLVSWARKIAGDNLIMTDDLWSTALRSYILPGQKIHRQKYPKPAFKKLIEKTVIAGNDMLMITFPAKVGFMVETIKDLAERNPAVKKHINDAVRRILINKQKLGLLKKPARIVANH